MGQFSFDVDQTNFQQIVMEGSHNAPVVIDFWAPWCGPCRSLKPILENLAEEYQGKFILAKVNADDNQALASQFGVRGIPAVKAVVDGQIVDEFSGALPEGAVREFLDRLVPSQADELRAQAAQQHSEGNLDAAMALLGQASQIDPENEDIRLDAAEILAEHNQTDEAQQLLNSLSPGKKTEDRAARLLAKLNFAQTGGDTDETALRQKIEANPEDMETRLELANMLVGSGRYAEGMDELLEMIRLDRSWNEETARQTLLAVFNLLAGDPLVSQYRRKLASTLN